MKYLAYLGLGSNLGNKQANLQAGLELLAEADLNVIKESPAYQTAPVGYLDQDSFVNLVVAVETDLEPKLLLRRIHEIEACCGRTRTVRWGPRTLDIDILLYFEGEEAAPLSIENEELTIPHPEIANRAFVLIPLLAIAPELVISNLGSVAELAGKLAAAEIAEVVQL